MFGILRPSRMVLLVLAALLPCATGVGYEIATFPVESIGGITSRPDGAIWYSALGKIGRIDTTGAVTEFPTSTAGPKLQNSRLTFGPDGNLWFISPGRISRMTTTGVVTEFPAPSLVVPSGRITSGPDGNVWFTAFQKNLIGRISTSGVITEFHVPTAGACPYGIVTGPDGNLWFTEYCAERIGRITTDGAMTEFALSKNGNRFPVGIAAGPDGNLWFTEQAARVGRITPNGVITEFPVPSEWGPTYEVAAGTDGNLWFVGWGEVHRVTTSGAVTTFSGIPTSEPLGVAVSPDGAIWIAGAFGGFGEDVSQILRFKLDADSCVADATTLCLNNGRFRVTAQWRTIDGSNGQGRGVALTSDSGYFSFFDSANVELIVKIVNGCSAWVFAAGLTNVEVTLKVTDTWTGLSREYTNPQGTPFAPIQDTSGFTACRGGRD